MKRLLALLLLVTILPWSMSSALAGSAGGRGAPRNHRLAAPDRGPAANHVPGEIIVKYKRSATSLAATGLERAAGAKPAADQPGIPGAKLLRVSPDHSEAESLAKLRRSPMVEYAEPNYTVKALYRPNDPEFIDQWALENTGGDPEGYEGWAYTAQAGSTALSPSLGGVGNYWGVPDADIDATDVWNFERGSSNPVTVAVLDTGIDSTHPDLASKIWTNSAEAAGVAGVDDDGNGVVDDLNGISTIEIGQTLYPSDIIYLGSSAPDTNYSEIAQSLSVDATTTISTVQLALFRYGVPTEGVKVSLRTSLAGADIASYDLAAADVTSTTEKFDSNYEIIAPVEKQFTAPVQLVPGETYYIVAHTNANDYDNSYGVFALDRKFNAKVDPFPAGMLHRYDTTWTADRGFDLFFHTDAGGVLTRDDYGHGTHVAGIAAAASGNSKGVAGISFGAKLMPVKVLDRNGMGTVAGLAKGMIYAADNGARVINMSLGYEDYSQTMQDAIDYADSQGVVVVAAAGNEGASWGRPSAEPSPLIYPAANNHVIAVGASDSLDRAAYFSSHNSSVDIAAPGEWILSTTPTYTVELTDWYGLAPDYDYLDGTSMASPHVAGVAALMLSVNPALTPAQVEYYLRKGADDRGTAGRDDYFGSGRLNAARSVAKAMLDTTAPAAGRLQVNGGSRFVKSRNVRINTPATDADSAVAEMRLANSGSAWSAWRPYARAASWRLSARDGRKAVAVRFRDWAGNVSGIKYVRVVLDQVKPTAVVSCPSTAAGATFTVNWNGTDDRSGVAAFDVYVRSSGSGAWVRWKRGTVAKTAHFTGSSGHTYAFKAYAIDRAGNRGGSIIATTVVP